MKILVTGCAGQLGRELQELLEERQPGVGRYIDIDTLDLTDAAAVMEFVTAGAFTHIVNCAAYTAVDRAEEEKSQCTAANVDGTRNLAAAAAATGARMLHISTDYVFDGNAHRPYKESDKPAPASHYGSTKRKSETALFGFVPDAIVIRTGWLYSPHGHNFVKTILNRAREGAKLRVVCDQIGTPTYARDLARAIETILFAPRWVDGIYHFSDEGVASWYDFACAIVEIGGVECAPIRPIHSEDYPTPAARPFFSVLDKSKIKATYDIAIPHWREALKHCMARM